MIPAIKRDWPRARRGETIWAQHDNAPSNNLNEDPDINREGTADGWGIKFINQPPNSPDLNILDLGFFNSIQSLQDRTTPRAIGDLIAEVNTAFNAQGPEKLGAVWTTLQTILQEIMLAKGDNTFKLPHLKKATTERRGGSIPIELPCSQGGVGGGSFGSPTLTSGTNCWYPYQQRLFVMFAYCCDGTAVASEKKGKIIKLTRLTMLFARAETRGCYPSISWAYPGDVSFRPLFMTRI